MTPRNGTVRSPSAPSRVVRAAGVLPWRERAGELQVALVHRPRYDDWSWAKGKLDPGEDWAVAAVREAQEETGLRVRLGIPLPPSERPLDNGSVKQVHYWAAQPIGGHGALEHEIDEVAWLAPVAAAQRLSYGRDREQLDALVDAHAGGRLATWPLIVVRHARAVPRSAWSKADPKRPLDSVGRRRAERLVPLLAAYAPERVVTSPSARCHDTVAPFARAHGLRPEGKKGLAEEGYAAAPKRAHRHLARLLEQGRPAVLCSHGKVLPGLLPDLLERADTKPARRVLRRLAEGNLDKGEALVVSVAGRGSRARVVAVERHRPTRSAGDQPKRPEM